MFDDIKTSKCTNPLNQDNCRRLPLYFFFWLMTTQAEFYMGPYIRQWSALSITVDDLSHMLFVGNLNSLCSQIFKEICLYTRGRQS